MRIIKLLMVVLLILGSSTIQVSAEINEEFTEKHGNIKEHFSDKPAPNKENGWYKFSNEYYYYDIKSKSNVTGVRVLENNQYLFDETGKLVDILSSEGFALYDYKPGTLEGIDFGKHQDFANKIYEWLLAEDYEWEVNYIEKFENEEEAKDFFKKINEQVIKNPNFYLEYKWYPNQAIIKLTEKWRSYIPCYEKVVSVVNEIVVDKHLKTVNEVVNAISTYAATEFRYSKNEESGLFSAMEKQETICGGFSTFFEYSMSLFGFDVDWIYGYVDYDSPENYHAWNSLTYESNTYYFDLTFANDYPYRTATSIQKNIDKFSWKNELNDRTIICVY